MQTASLCKIYYVLSFTKYFKILKNIRKYKKQNRRLFYKSIWKIEKLNIIEKLIIIWNLGNN